MDDYATKKIHKLSKGINKLNFKFINLKLRKKKFKMMPQDDCLVVEFYFNL